MDCSDRINLEKSVTEFQNSRSSACCSLAEAVPVQLLGDTVHPKEGPQAMSQRRAAR